MSKPTIVSNTGHLRSASGSARSKIEAAGFKQFKESGVNLDIRDVREMDAALQLGQVFGKPSRCSERLHCCRARTQRGDHLSADRATSPERLNGRDYLRLAALSAGNVPAAAAGRGIRVGGQAGSPCCFPARWSRQQQPTDFYRTFQPDRNDQALGRCDSGIQRCKDPSTGPQVYRFGGTRFPFHEWTPLPSGFSVTCRWPKIQTISTTTC